jgi:capsular polysaccharide biosynthesis protein
MGEQAIEMRSALSVLRRRRTVLCAAALVGAAAGATLVLVRPPLYVSQSQVLLPPSQDASGQAVTRDVSTAVKVAGSDVVLGPVASKFTPRPSPRTLAKSVDITAPTSDVLQFEARAGDPEEAEKLAAAVAEAQVAYSIEGGSSLTDVERAGLRGREQSLAENLEDVTREIVATTKRREAEDPAGAAAKADATALARLTAEQADLALQIDHVKDQVAASASPVSTSVIQEASAARRQGLVARLAVFGGAGAAVALVATAALLVLRRARDRRLRYRDEIADAVGSPVVGSVHAPQPRDAAAWTSVLADYQPETVDAWGLRQVLRQLGEWYPGGGHHADDGRSPALPESVLVVTLAGDLRALTVGPQLAVCATSMGTSTALVAAQSHPSAAALWVAAAHNDGRELRDGLVVRTGRDASRQQLTVVLAVLDPADPRLDPSVRGDATLIVVSPGSATAEDLASAAMAADDLGHRVDGVVVADPDDLDRTTGRLLQHERARQAAVPTRLTGLPTPGGSASVHDLRSKP